MLSFKFTYLRKPSKEYKLKYGLENKARPYFFNHPIGLSGGKYRFNYDRRDRVHVEDSEISLVKWARDINICEESTFVKWPRDININKDQSFVKWARDIDINRGLSFAKWARALETNKEYIQELKEKVMERECSKNKTFEGRYKEIILEEEYTLETLIKELALDLGQLLARTVKEVVLEKNQIDLGKDVKEIIKETEREGFKRRIKFLHIINELEGLVSPVSEFLKEGLTKTLGTDSKSIERETGRLISRVNPFELEYEATTKMLKKIKGELSKEADLKELYFELPRQIIKNLDVKLYNTLTKDLEVNKWKLGDGGLILYKEFKEILLYEIVSLFNSPLDIDIEKRSRPIFKKLNEIYKHQTPVENIVFLYTLYDISIDEAFMQLELKEELINVFKHILLEKRFEVDLERENTPKSLVGNFKHDLSQKIQERLIEIVPNKKIEIEKCFKQLEEVYGIIIDIENRMKQLGKEHIVDLYKEQDVYQLIKKLVIHDLITEDESIEFKESPIGKILLENSMALKKNQKEIEIIIDESIPMVKAYKEIIINNDIKATKEAIEIDIDKEKEFKKVVSEIEIEASEETIKFNKRFWFLRATDPFDLKILPYSDYPYKSDPIMFDSEKLIPDNWQLDLIPGLHKEIKEHPIPFGSNLGREEMALSIEIIIDVINIMILIWSRMFYNFSGYTGSQAVIRFTKILYDWLMLEESLEEMNEKGSTEHYFRCYNWIRWEAEKVAIKARDDMSLSGNMYIDEWIFELIYYMENHHFDTMPIFDVVQKMDEYRAQLPIDDPQGDINFILDKVKGMRHKIIECKANKSNE